MPAFGKNNKMVLLLLTLFLDSKKNVDWHVKSKSNIEAKIENLEIKFLNCEQAIKKRAALLNEKDFKNRLRKKDTTLWSSDPKVQNQISNSLGWLDLGEKMQVAISEIEAFVQQIQKAGFENVLHMGMGGSSLAALVFAETFTSTSGLSLTVLDTTDPIKFMN